MTHAKTRPTQCHKTVQRAGDRVRINVQLIDAATDAHLWAESFDRQLTAANLFDIQRQIAISIAEALRATLSPAEQDRLASAPTKNLAAYEVYLLGRQRMANRNSATMAEAIGYFQQAIELDPDFALAYVGLADSLLLTANYNWSPTPIAELQDRVEAAINVALRLDDRLGEAYASLGLLRNIKFDYEDAEAAYKQALELNPNYAPTYKDYAILLMYTDRVEQAINLLENGVEADPLSVIMKVNMGQGLGLLGRFEEAGAQIARATEINPRFGLGYGALGELNWTAWGKLDEAVVLLRKAVALDPRESQFGLAPLGTVYLDLGHEQQAELLIRRAVAVGPENSNPNYAMAFVLLYRGEAEDASKYVSAGVAINLTTWWARARAGTASGPGFAGRSICGSARPLRGDLSAVAA